VSERGFTKWRRLLSAGPTWRCAGCARHAHDPRAQVAVFQLLERRINLGLGGKEVSLWNCWRLKSAQPLSLCNPCAPPRASSAAPKRILTVQLGGPDEAGA